jgi:hypothetical protein
LTNIKYYNQHSAFDAQLENLHLGLLSF